MPVHSDPRWRLGGSGPAYFAQGFSTSLRALLVCFLLTGAAQAQSSEQQIINRMEAEGYSIVGREISWLGRVVLEGKSATHEREVIFNPTNGEVLRDYVEPRHEESSEEDTGWFRHLFSPLSGDED